jgi:hypothetical protein
MARILVALTLLSTSLATAWLILRRPFREICEEIAFERARERFRGQRERLEARFLASLSRLRPDQSRRWDDAHWQDEVVWARDRKTRSVMALVGVQFEPPAYGTLGEDDGLEDGPQYATALFEFRRGAWTTDGRCLDELRPDEAVLLHNRLEPVHVAHRRPSQPDGPLF